MTACRFICHRVFAKSFCLCGWCKVRLILLLCTTRITRKIKTSIENKRSLRLYKYSFLNKNDSSNLIHFHFPWINYRFGWYIKFKRGGGGKIFQRIPRTGHLLYSKVKYVLFSKLIKHFWPFYGSNYG